MPESYILKKEASHMNVTGYDVAGGGYDKVNYRKSISNLIKRVLATINCLHHQED